MISKIFSSAFIYSIVHVSWLAYHLWRKIPSGRTAWDTKETTCERQQTKRFKAIRISYLKCFNMSCKVITSYATLSGGIQFLRIRHFFCIPCSSTRGDISLKFYFVDTHWNSACVSIRRNFEICKLKVWLWTDRVNQTWGISFQYYYGCVTRTLNFCKLHGL